MSDEEFQSVRLMRRGSSSSGRLNYSGFLLQSSSARLEQTGVTTYSDISLGGVPGSLKLDEEYLTFSPSSLQPSRSWEWGAIEKHLVKERAMLVKVNFETVPGSHLPQESIIFSLSSPDTLKKLMRDMAHRIHDAKRFIPATEKRASTDEPPPLMPVTTAVATSSSPSQSPEEAAPLVGKSASVTVLEEGEDSGWRDEEQPMVARMSPTVQKPLQIEQFTDEEAEGEDDEAALTEDIYSLLFVASIRSRAFWFGFITFLCQMTVLLQICKLCFSSVSGELVSNCCSNPMLAFSIPVIDLVDLSSDPPLTSSGKPNRLQIPAGVNVSVTIAQFIGVFMTINFLLDGGDLIKGFDFLANGYVPGMREQTRHATKFKWAMAGVLQATSGCFMLTNLFILSMQSTSVIMFCLNFAALQ